MEYKILPEEYDVNQFNERAKHPLQSWQWGEVRKKTGVTVVRIGSFEKDSLREVFTMTIHLIPHTSFKIGYVPRSILPSKELLIFLKAYGQEKKMLFIKFEPYETGEFGTNNVTLKKSSHPLFPRWTQVLDLRAEEETLLKNMKSKTRYNIRYAERKGVVVREQSDGEGFQVFSDLYFKTTQRQEYRGHDRSYHQAVWNGLKGNFAHILVAYYHDTPLAAYELFAFKDQLYYPYGGSSTKHRDLMGSNLLMWEAIKLGKKLNKRTFDMWGSLPPTYDRKGKWSGFTRFKEGYGTKFVKFVGSYDMVINPLLYPIYSLAYQIRNAII